HLRRLQPDSRVAMGRAARLGLHQSVHAGATLNCSVAVVDPCVAVRMGIGDRRGQLARRAALALDVDRYGGTLATDSPGRGRGDLVGRGRPCPRLGAAGTQSKRTSPPTGRGLMCQVPSPLATSTPRSSRVLPGANELLLGWSSGSITIMTVSAPCAMPTWNSSSTLAVSPTVAPTM